MNEIVTILPIFKGPLSASLIYGQSVASLASARAATTEKRPYWPDVQVYYQNLEDDSLTVKCAVVLVRPHSKGRLTLNSQKNIKPDDPAFAALNFQYLGDPGDVDVMIEGTKTHRRINYDSSKSEF